MRSFAIITTRANELCAELRDRMPVILSRESWPVSPRVGNVNNNDPSLIESIVAAG